MLNPDLKLNPKIFNDDVEQVPIRTGFGKGLVEAGETNKDIVALSADLTESTQMHFFKEKFPEFYSIKELSLWTWLLLLPVLNTADNLRKG